MKKKSASKRSPNRDLKALEAHYREIEPLANRLGDEIRHQLEQLIREQGIVLGLPIQQRTKSWDSVQEKIDRKSLSISLPQELNDLVGLRVIVQFLRDLEVVQSLIRAHFTIIEEHSAENRLKEDQFGYTSIHFIIELPNEWLSVPTLTAMKGLRAEIQLRTTAQHIWAAASHTLQYKQETSVPIPIRRAIHRVSALLETVDLEFDRVLQERGEYRASISSKSIDRRLNVDLLEEILESVFPANNKKPQEPYARLLSDLELSNITSSKELETLLKERRHVAMKRESQIVNMLRNSENPESEGYSYDPERVAAGIYFTHVGLARVALDGLIRRRSKAE